MVVCADGCPACIGPDPGARSGEPMTERKRIALEVLSALGVGVVH